MNSGRISLIQKFLQVVRENSDRAAVVEDGKVYSYLEFYSFVYQIYNEALNKMPARAIGLFSGRSLLSYAGMWASIFLGLPYVPLNPSLPASRLRQVAYQSNLDICIFSDYSSGKVAEILPDLRGCLLCMNFLQEGQKAVDFSIPSTAVEQETAYILFTSGSTGKPKGVPVSYANLLAFVENVNGVIDYRSDDRVAQVCETSFDFSVHEIYLTLLNGASLYPARNIDLFNPSQYIQKNRLTVWHSVPSLAFVALNNMQSGHDALDSIRVSIFNGEPLTTTFARQWQTFAPNSQIWNFYGPTECTVAVSAQRVEIDNRSIFRGNNIAIGRFFDECHMALLCDGHVINGRDFSQAINGELLIGGVQTFQGYLDSEIDSPFVRDREGEVFYKTGDLAEWDNERLFIMGRLDHQIKIGGYRIELLEIEHQLKDFFNVEQLAVVAIPEGNPKSLVVCSEVEIDLNSLKQSDTPLPNYMIPSRVEVIDKLPKNQNGKLDRTSIMALIG